MIKKFYGPPGTGKTEKLIRRALAYIRIGTPVKRIGYFAFTKKAALEAKERMLNKNRQFQKKDLKYFQTLHSLAFHTLGLNEENVMQDYHYDDLGKELSISVKAKRDLDSSPYLTCDNEYFQIITKAREKDIEVWDEYCTGEYNKDIRPNILKHVAANYIKYKKNQILSSLSNEPKLSHKSKHLLFEIANLLSVGSEPINLPKRCTPSVEKGRAACLHRPCHHCWFCFLI